MDALCAICGKHFDKRGKAKTCSVECGKSLRAKSLADNYRDNKDAVLARHAGYRSMPGFTAEKREYDRKRYDPQRGGKRGRPSLLTDDERKLARRAYNTAYVRRRRQATRQD